MGINIRDSKARSKYSIKTAPTFIAQVPSQCVISAALEINKSLHIIGSKSLSDAKLERVLFKVSCETSTINQETG
jgi:hypothetical protein